MSLIAAGGGSPRPYYYSLAAVSHMPAPTEAAVPRHPRVERSTAKAPSPACPITNLPNRTRTAARNAYATPPHSDSDPHPSSSPTSCFPLTTTPIKTIFTTTCSSSQPAPQALLPIHLFPEPHPKLRLPSSIRELTPKLLRCLAYDSSAVHRIPCTLLEFRDWRYRYRKLLDSESDRTLSRLWEYDERIESFIIRCMPSPVHESICRTVCWHIFESMHSALKVNPERRGILINTNTDIDGLGKTKNSKRIPDLSIEVESTQGTTISSIVMEVGFSQGLPSLRKKAIGWFQDLQDLHMCILIDIMEQAQEYVDATEERISKSKAKKLKNEWPDWLICDDSDDSGRALTLREEIVRRMGGRMVETQAEGEQLLLGIQEDLCQWLLEQDHEGVLLTALVEPMDATIYVYGRGGNDEEERVDCPQAIGRDAGGETKEGNSDDDDGIPISLIFSAPFLKSSEPTPPSPHIPTQLAFTIAELYGPLPQLTPSQINSSSDPNSPQVSAIPSGLLELIPPAVRPHAHSMIIIPFDELGELVLKSIKKMRTQRAQWRGRKIVEREWEKVWESVSKAREVKHKGERQLERAERVVERRKRKAHDSDVDVNPSNTDEERTDACRITRVRVQGETHS